MAVFTFSTKDKTRPTDKTNVEEVKTYCEAKGINFSALVTKLVIEWKQENMDGKGRD